MQFVLHGPTRGQLLPPIDQGHCQVTTRGQNLGHAPGDEEAQSRAARQPARGWPSPGVRRNHKFPPTLDGDHDSQQILIKNRRVPGAPHSIRTRDDEGASVLQPSGYYTMSEHHVVATKNSDLTNLDLGGGARTYSEQISRAQRRVHARPAHRCPGFASPRRRLFRVYLDDGNTLATGLAGR
jgi:hypothetical protein